MKSKIKCKIIGYEDIEFEVGQVWLDGNGVRVTIIDIDDSLFPIIVEEGRSYSDRGIYRFDLESSQDDLVSLHVEEPTEELIEDSVEDSVEEPVEEQVDSRLIIVEQEELAIEDKMASILIQLLSQRDKDLEKLSLVFNTYLQLEKMR